MRIINRETFLSLPAGVIYQIYIPPTWFGPLSIKGETIEIGAGGEDDLWLTQLSADAELGYLDELQDSWYSNGKKRFDVAMIEERESCFDPTRLYAVWEEDDLWEIRHAIDTAFLLDDKVVKIIAPDEEEPLLT